MSIFLWLGVSIFFVPIIFIGVALISKIKRKYGTVAMLTTIVTIPLYVKVVMAVFSYYAYSMKRLSQGGELKFFEMFTDGDKYCVLALVVCSFIFFVSSWIYQKKENYRYFWRKKEERTLSSK